VEITKSCGPAVRFHSHTFLSIVARTKNIDWTLQTADVVVCTSSALVVIQAFLDAPFVIE
jgi:hypothetical protein